MQLVTAIAAGDVHSLAIQNGDVYAWGMGDFGALGNGVDEEVNYSNVPLKVLDLDIDLVSVSAGNFTSYALSADGSLWVWGRNDNGQLGLGHNTDQVAPVQRIPPAGYRFTGIEVGGFHAVALIASTAINASAAVETGINQQIAPGGGTTVTGGTQVTFANILTPGDFTLEYAATTFDELDLPRVVSDFAFRPMGLVLVCGPTGSGKSTTLAAIIDRINRERSVHIITVEDPIEYLHHHHNSVINQREVNSDTKSFANALKHILRQDPDVILIGEMRDTETIAAALTVAETGHLAFATLHTNDAVQTINRIVDVFPASQQAQVRTQLSFVLEGVVVQQLIPRADGNGRALAMELMLCNTAIRSLIRAEKIEQIPSMIEIGAGEGMMTMNQSLYRLARRNVITLDMAMKRTADPEGLQRLLEKGP